MIFNRRSLTDAKNIGEVLAFNKFDVFLDEELSDFILMPEETRHILDLAGGFWQHNGDTKAPHAVIRAGKHSDGFINLPMALKYSAINNLFAASLVNKMNRQNLGRIDWVVGSDHAAATFSSAVAQRLAVEWKNCDIKHDFTEKIMFCGEETQRWARHIIGKDERVLQIEDLCTTNLTLKCVREGIANAHPDYPINYAPIIGMAVNRTGSNSFNGSKIVSLFDITFNEWQWYECPLCAGGSEPLKGVKKSAAIWAKLTGRPATL